MSRSYKRHPGMSDGDRSKRFSKNQAARRVRHYELDMPNGGKYKTLYERWYICDHNFRMYSWRETREWAEKWAYEEKWWRKKDYNPAKEADYTFWRYTRK